MTDQEVTNKVDWRLKIAADDFFHIMSDFFKLNILPQALYNKGIESCLRFLSNFQRLKISSSILGYPMFICQIYKILKTVKIYLQNLPMSIL